MNRPQPDSAPGRGRIVPATGRGSEGWGRSCTATRRRSPDHSAVMCTYPSACRPECLTLFPTSSDTSTLASPSSSGGIARAPRDRRTSARDPEMARTRRSSRDVGSASGETPFASTITVYPADEPSTPLGNSSSMSSTSTGRTTLPARTLVQDPLGTDSRPSCPIDLRRLEYNHEESGSRSSAAHGELGRICLGRP